MFNAEDDSKNAKMPGIYPGKCHFRVVFLMFQVLIWNSALCAIIPWSITNGFRARPSIVLEPLLETSLFWIDWPPEIMCYEWAYLKANFRRVYWNSGGLSYRGSQPSAYKLHQNGRFFLSWFGMHLSGCLKTTRTWISERTKVWKSNTLSSMLVAVHKVNSYSERNSWSPLYGTRLWIAKTLPKQDFVTWHCAY